MAALLFLGSLGSALGASPICGGLTPKTSAWEAWRGDAISMLVDTSACGFSGGAPAYAASVDQLARPVVRDPFLTEQLLPGSLTLLHVSATSFRAVMWDPARPLLKLSVEHGWAVSWMGSEAGAGAGVAGGVGCAAGRTGSGVGRLLLRLCLHRWLGGLDVLQHHVHVAPREAALPARPSRASSGVRAGLGGRLAGSLELTAERFRFPLRLFRRGLRLLDGLAHRLRHLRARRVGSFPLRGLRGFASGE